MSPATSPGIRFYKGPDNTGTHVGHLWTGSGTLLGEATFTGESASGWQEVRLRRPDPDRAGHHLCRLLPRPQRRLRRHHRLLRRPGHRQPAPACARRRHRRRQRRLQLRRRRASSRRTPSTPTNYWVDVVFDDDVGPDTTPPSINSTHARTAARRASARAPTSTRDVQRANERRDDQRRQLRASRRLQRARAGHGLLLAGDSHRDARPRPTRSSTRPSTRPRSRAARAGSRTSPGTRAVPTTAGRSPRPPRHRRRPTRGRAGRSS